MAGREKWPAFKLIEIKEITSSADNGVAILGVESDATPQGIGPIPAVN